MKRELAVALVVLAIASPAKSFELDGFRSGMTIAEVKALHPAAVVKPYNASVPDITIGSRYELQTCRGKVHNITVYLDDMNEIFGYLQVFQEIDGPASIRATRSNVDFTWYKLSDSWRIIRCVNSRCFVEQMLTTVCDVE